MATTANADTCYCITSIPMAALVDTMTSSGASKKQLIDGLKVVLPTVILVAVGFAFLRRANQTLLPVALDFATAAAIGVTAGLTTRWSLKARAEILRWIVAVAMAISGLIILGMVTWGEAGLKMLYLRDGIDWNGLGQATVSASSALLALRAWSWRAPLITSPPDSQPEPILPRSQPQSFTPPPNGSIRPRPAAPSWRRSIRLRLRRGATRVQAAPRARVISQMPRPIVLPRWKLPIWKLPRVSLPRVSLPKFSLQNFNFRDLFGFRESQVKFTGASEQRCPYCLDVITKNDPRGVHACPICHTPHHGDCWAMTGVCQVPHYHG